MRFTFNKKARAAAVRAIKHLESGSFLTAILGSFSARPQVTAISSFVLFCACRFLETVIAGIEDDDDASKPPKRGGKALPAPKVEEIDTG